MCARIPRIGFFCEQTDGGIRIGQRFARAAEPIVGPSAIVQRLSIAGVAPDRLGVIRNRGVPILLFVLNGAAESVSGRCRRNRKRGRHARERAIEIAAVAKRLTLAQVKFRKLRALHQRQPHASVRCAALRASTCGSSSKGRAAKSDT